MIAVVDYKKGNLLSVQRGLSSVGAHVVVTSEPAEIAAASAIVLPGVGAFADAAATMRQLGQMDVIRDRVLAGVPFLGICLGMHLMFAEGAEGARDVLEQQNADDAAGRNGANGQFDMAAACAYAQGLGLLPGLVGALPRKDAQGNAYKIPHVGWNQVYVSPLRDSLQDKTRGNESIAIDPLFQGIPQGEHFYFTHSYAAPDSPATIATTTHSITFPCAVKYGQYAYGVQFHPEKSSDAGLTLLKNFVSLAKEA